MTTGVHPPHAPRTDPLVPERTPPGLLHHPVPAASGDYRWVYIWQAPLRAMHWISAFTIVALVVTGLWIGRPWFLPPVETTGSYTVQWMRLLHFGAAALLVATAIVRVYWLFAGNKFERLPALFPLRPRDMKNLFKVVQAYLFIHPERAPKYLGHHPLQQLSYTAVYLATLVMIVTGFAMYGQAEPGGFIHDTTGWVAPLFGGMQNVRIVHHVLTWYFIIFPIFHVYLAVRADIVEREGTISSITAGGRFVPAEERFEDE